MLPQEFDAMPRAARLLIDALERYPPSRPEDRLTEVFAALLAAVPDLAHRFTAKAFIAATGEQIDARDIHVLTQQPLSRQARPDMTISLTDQYNERRRLVCEHKISAAPTPAQLKEYVDRRPDDELIIIAPAAYDEFAGLPALTWQEVAMLVDRVGRDSGGRYWRERALAADACASQRLLAEALAFLERQNVGVSILDPFGTQDVVTFRHSRTALGKIEALFRALAADKALEALGPKGPGEARDPRIAGTHGTDPAVSWYVHLDRRWPALAGWEWCVAEILVSPVDDWIGDPLSEPAIAAGFSFDARRQRWPEALGGDSELLGELEQREASVGRTDHGNVGRCVKTLYLSELAARGRTLSDQASWAARWCARAIEDIAATGAALVERPP